MQVRCSSRVLGRERTGRAERSATAARSPRPPPGLRHGAAGHPGHASWSPQSISTLRSSQNTAACTGSQWLMPSVCVWGNSKAHTLARLRSKACCPASSQESGVQASDGVQHMWGMAHLAALFSKNSVASSTAPATAAHKTPIPMTAVAASGLEGSCACSNTLQCRPAKPSSVGVNARAITYWSVQQGVSEVDRCSPCHGCIWARLARDHWWPHQR